MDAYIQIAQELKEQISKILAEALRGDEKYISSDEKTYYIRWGIVEKDMHETIDRNLLSDETSNDTKEIINQIATSPNQTWKLLCLCDEDICNIISARDRLLQISEPGRDLEIFTLDSIIRLWIKIQNKIGG